MLGREPKDFDVVTDARPEEIRKLFHSARIIGRRFRLVHVRSGREIIEVATFRAIPRDALEEPTGLAEDGEPGEGGDDNHADAKRPGTVDQNVFGNQEEDAVRRDFTVNGLYYNIRDFSVMDYVGGVADLKRGLLRIIGDPAARFREDPVRMLRAVRFAAKLGFNIEPRTEAPIRELAPLLLSVPPARMFEEVLKLFHGGAALKTFELLRHYDLFQHLFPLTEQSLTREEGHFPITLVPRALENTDARINIDKPVTPAFLFAALLWEPTRFRVQEYLTRGRNAYDALMLAADDVLSEQLRHVSIPKRFSVPMREIWMLQGKFERRSGKQAQRLFEHPRFRAAYDFLLLRVETGEASKELAEWWTRYQEVAEPDRDAMISTVAPSAAEGPKRRRRRRRKKPAGGTSPSP